MDGATDGKAYAVCPHCHERPECAPHLCPLNLEADGCGCCGVCAKTCADSARHLEVHTAALYLDPGTGDLFISYVQVADADKKLPEGIDLEPDGDDWDFGGFGLSA
jgi:hypothetical protein